MKTELESTLPIQSEIEEKPSDMPPTEVNFLYVAHTAENVKQILTRLKEDNPNVILMELVGSNPEARQALENDYNLALAQPDQLNP